MLFLSPNIHPIPAMNQTPKKALGLQRLRGVSALSGWKQLSQKSQKSTPSLRMGLRPVPPDKTSSF